MKHTIVWVGDDAGPAADAKSGLCRHATDGAVRTVAEVRDASGFFAQSDLLIVIDALRCRDLGESIRRLRATVGHAVFIGWAAGPRHAALSAALRIGVDAVAGGRTPPWARVLRDARGHALARRRLDDEAHFRRFFEHNSLPSAVADAEGRLLAANQTMLRALGRKWAEIEGLSLLDLVRPAECDLEALRAVVAGAAEHGEADVAFVTPDGAGLPTSVHLFRTRNGASRSTDRLFLTANRYRPAPMAVERRQAVFTHTGVGIAASAIDAPWADVNPALQRIFDLPPRISRNTLMEITHPEDRFIDTELFEQLLEGRRESYQIEKRYVHPASGALLWCLLIVSLERDGTGAPQTIFATVVDITEKKLAEDRLRESQAQLYHAQKLEAIGRLTGGVAHDLNNVLMAVDFNLHDLRRIDVPPAAEEAIAEIEAATSRARRMTKQLLATSRKQHLQPARLSLNAALNDLARMLETLVGAGIEIRYVLDDELPDVIVDQGQLEQVILNLVVNARDAMQDGGVLTLRTRRDSRADAASGTAAAPFGFAMLEVEDAGTGIDPDVLKRIFEPFFTTKEMGKGTGLGLSTVWGIVEQSGGEVRVESERGRGTTFHVALPIAEAAVPAEGAAAPGDGAAPPADSTAPPIDSTAPPAHAQPAVEHRAQRSARSRVAGETVLLVDDETLIRKIVHRMLEEDGYRVLSAGGSDSALRAVEEFGGTIDALVTDIVMPGGDGRDLATNIETIFPGIRVILMSGYVPGDEASLEDLPHRRFLQKPVDPATLSRTLRELLDAAVPAIRPARQSA